MQVVHSPPKEIQNRHYVSNRPPLAPSPFVKLPIGSIRPRGWLGHMLELEAEGMVGRLPELSKWCKAKGNAWRSADGQGHSPWEELPYWLKGFGDLGYVLEDPRIIEEARQWIDAVLLSQEEDGYFGPRANKTRIDGKPDMWPNMIMLNCLQSFHEFTGDERVPPFMANYFRWQMGVPEEEFLVPFWQKIRAGDNLESVYWLYNRIGDESLLDLAEKIHARTADWTGGIANWHGVNIAQGFREPAVYFMQANDEDFIRAAERNYEEVMARFGRVPGGMFGADENCRKGFSGPRQAAETCTMVEFMHSFEMLTKITGDPVWADRCEEVAFNSFPASRTPDLKGLHYLTAPNMVLLDKENKAPGLQNAGCMLAFDPHSYRCCQHNVSHGWPYMSEELWLATSDGGLCASLYAASDVRAKVGDGGLVRIREETDYPFGEEILFTFEAKEPVQFPLYLRIPGWCGEAKIELNGGPIPQTFEPLRYAVIERAWATGDRLKLILPMKIAVTRWEENEDSLSIRRGPLWFSLKIEEEWKRYGGTDAWPAFEVHPATAWNFGLELDAEHPGKSIEVVEKPGPLAAQPFTLENAPIELRAKARRIPEWTLDEKGLIHELQPSPARTEEELETVFLIPMGCARLRIASFPAAIADPGAEAWKAPLPPPEASHCFWHDTTTALNDGILPKDSCDQTIPRFTWWDRKGSREWAAYRFDEPRVVSCCEVYWFDDEKVGGGCRAPASWRILWKDGEGWKEMENPSAFDTALDTFNRVDFDPVLTREIRIEVTLKTNYSGGILEWRVDEGN